MANGRGWRYPEDFRCMAVERFKNCENIEWLAKELVVCPVYNFTEQPASFSPWAGWIRV
jgi:hypothetical protein